MLDQNSNIDNNSLLGKLIKKEERDGSIIPFYPTPIFPQVVFPNSYNEETWRITQQKGVSEDEAEASVGEVTPVEKQVKN